MRLLGLTLWRPWPWAIFAIPETEQPKRIENRDWAPPGWAVGHYLAIHAGNEWDEAGAALMRSWGLAVPTPDQHPSGCIVGVVRLAGYTRAGWDDRWRAPGMPYGWRLDQVRAIEPVPCRGLPKLWIPPSHVKEAVREAWRAAGERLETRGAMR